MRPSDREVAPRGIPPAQNWSTGIPPPALVKRSSHVQHKIAAFAPYLAEFVGSLLLALAWNTMEITKETTRNNVTVPGWPPKVTAYGNSTLHQTHSGFTYCFMKPKPIVVGLMTMVATYSFASISGAHLNPAVSLAVGFSNKGQWRYVCRYIACQFLGCIVGVQAALLLFHQHVPKAAPGPRKWYIHGVMFRLFMVEYTFTTLLCFVFLNVTLSRKNNPVQNGNQFYGLAIGCVIIAGTAASDHISGAFFNPALTFSAELHDQVFDLAHSLLYFLFQCLAAFSAAVIYRAVRPHEDHVDYHSWREAVEDEQETINAPKMICEALGTGFCVFTFGMTAASKRYELQEPFAAGLALASMNYAVGDVSGGHFNPAITLSVMLNGRGQITVFHGFCYMLVQATSAGVTSILVTMCMGTVDDMVAGSSFSSEQADCVSVVYSFAVSYVFLAVSTVRGINTPVGSNFYRGLTYGLTVAAGGFALALVSHMHAISNPAVTLGQGVVDGVSLVFQGKGILEGFSTMVTAILFATTYFVGSVFASVAFRITHASVFRKYAALHPDDESTPLVDSCARDARKTVMKGAAEGIHRISLVSDAA